MVYAKSSANKFGGKPEDYIDIHEFLDSSAEAYSNVSHRALTHHQWFIRKVLVRVFGQTRVNSAAREYSVIEVAEQHVLEDFHGKFIPSAQDYLEQIEFQAWMDNGANETVPPSCRKLRRYQDTLGSEPKPFNIKPPERESDFEPSCRDAPPGVLD